MVAGNEVAILFTVLFVRDTFQTGGEGDRYSGVIKVRPERGEVRWDQREGKCCAACFRLVGTRGRLSEAVPIPRGQRGRRRLPRSCQSPLEGESLLGSSRHP